jgi:CheY-like chemotaxis protein
MAIQEQPEISSGAQASDVTVLFVDDEPEVLDLYNALYGPLYDVRTARSGEEALAEVGSHIDFVFVDRRMPGMSGDELTQTLREQGYEMPIAIVSAIEPDEEPSTEYDAYLTKPTEKEQIQETISRHLS